MKYSIHIKHYLLLMLIMLTVLQPLSARKRVASHFQLEVGGGATLFPFNQKELGSIFAGGQVELAAKYNYLFNNNEHWGLSVGAGLISFQGGQHLNALLSYHTIDDEGFPYELRAKVTNWYERQQSYAVTIPIGIFYQYKSRYSDVGFLMSLNAKLTVPFAANYFTSYGEITTTGYYEQWGGTVIENLPQHGFGYSNDFRPSGKLKAQLLGSAELQVGAFFTVARNAEMFVTFYYEQGFNDMFKPMTTQPLFTSLTKYNGFYNSKYNTNTIPMTFGLKLGFRLLDVHGCNCIRY